MIEEEIRPPVVDSTVVTVLFRNFRASTTALNVRCREDIAERIREVDGATMRIVTKSSGTIQAIQILSVCLCAPTLCANSLAPRCLKFALRSVFLLVFCFLCRGECFRLSYSSVNLELHTKRPTAIYDITNIFCRIISIFVARGFKEEPIG